MDTKQLITFVTFAKEKSYTKASMKLNYAVSTLSEHIAALEAELGITLVESRGRRSFLTKSGEAFLEYANQMLALWQETQEAMAFLNSIHGALYVLTAESLGLYRMAPVFAKFAKAFPQIDLSVSISTPSSFPHSLEAEEADMAFCYSLASMENNTFHAIEIFQEDMVFISYPKHPLAKKQAVLPGDFRSETFLLPHTESFYHQALKDLLARHGVALKIRMNLDSGSLIKQYVQAGHGISLLPRSVVQKELDSGALIALQWKGEALTALAQIVVLKKKWQKPAVKELIAFTQKVLD